MRDFLNFATFCSFPHRHCEAREKPETQEETHGSLKTSISCETSFSFDMLTPSKTTRFEAYPINTAKPERSQRLKRRHMGASKRAFHARIPSVTPSKTTRFAASPINTAKPERTQRLKRRHVGASKRAFRARLPSILTG